jgi:hypothetical protein
MRTNFFAGLFSVAVASFALLVVACASGDTGTSGSSASASTKDAAVACTVPDNQICDPKNNCGCPESQRCGPIDLTGAYACVFVGAKKLRATCRTSAECEDGACIQSICRKTCKLGGENTCSTRCRGFVTNDGEESKTVGVCDFGCDPTDANACGASDLEGTQTKCDSLKRGGFDCVVVANAKSFGQACTSDCNAGLICVLGSSGGSGTCKRICKIGSSSCGCQNFATPQVYNGATYGFCP